MFNPTPQDIEMLLAAQCHLGSKNLQVHMEPYLWKLRADGVNIINIGKTWYVAFEFLIIEALATGSNTGIANL
jgi:ribosomal protein S2